jgi:hypothetical protein
VRVTKSVVELDPATLLTYTRVQEAVTDAQLRAWLEDQERDFRALVARRARTVQLIDLSRAETLTAAQRRLQASWISRNEDLLRAAALGFVFVTESLLLRGVMTAIFWIKPPPVSHQTCASQEEALVWSFALCERGSLRVPAAARKQLARQLLEGPQSVRDFAAAAAPSAQSSGFTP